MHVPLTEVILTHDGTVLARATLPPGEYVIGREAGVDLFADTPLLSRRHARLTINYDHLLIEDLASSNGTFVNERPVTEPTRLFPNQSIRLGPDLALEIRRQRAPSEPGVSLAPAQAAIARHLPAELLAQRRYAIGGVVAQGGMGAILDARQNATQRTVAMRSCSTPRARPTCCASSPRRRSPRSSTTRTSSPSTSWAWTSMGRFFTP